MSSQREGYPRAAAVSPRLQVTDVVDSTNAKLLHDAAHAPASYPHLATLLSHEQTAGRGRLGRAWTAPAGTSLAISTLLRVEAVAVADRGWIPLIAGQSMAEAVSAQLRGRTVSIKWPNDVLVADSAGEAGRSARKISGILVEVLPSDPFTVVVGAGVNTTMATVDLPVPTATSFADQGAEVDEDCLLADYLTGLRDGIAELAVSGPSAISARIAEKCSTLGAEVTVSLPNGETLHGRAVRLDGAGHLVVEAAGGETVVGAGDVVHVR